MAMSDVYGDPISPYDPSTHPYIRRVTLHKQSIPLDPMREVIHWKDASKSHPSHGRRVLGKKWGSVGVWDYHDKVVYDFPGWYIILGDERMPMTPELWAEWPEGPSVAE